MAIASKSVNLFRILLLGFVALQGVFMIFKSWRTLEISCNRGTAGNFCALEDKNILGIRLRSEAVTNVVQINVKTSEVCTWGCKSSEVYSLSDATGESDIKLFESEELDGKKEEAGKVGTILADFVSRPREATSPETVSVLVQIRRTALLSLAWLAAVMVIGINLGFRALRHDHDHKAH